MFFTKHDIFIGLIAIGFIAIVITLIELFIKKRWLTKLWGRKLLHCIAICTCVWGIANFENRFLLAFIFLVFFFVLLWVIKKGWLQVNRYKTYGIALFPLAFATLLFIPLFNIASIVYGGLILAVADVAAGITGEYYGKEKIIFLQENKTWVGFAAFFVTTFIISFCYIGFTSSSILLCIVLAIVPSLTELFSYRGSDNFTVPVFSTIWLLLVEQFSEIGLFYFIVATIIFVLLSLLAIQKKWLTTSGATAACWVASLLLSTGGIKAFISPTIFLVSGSLLSKLNNNKNEKQGRNATQVFANGIVGVLLLIAHKLTANDIYLIAAIASFSISMADSVSSEIGVYFKKSTYDILSFKKLTPGLSGGISTIGTLAGLVGAFVIALAASMAYNFSISICLFITCIGFTGMLVDSILGSFLQSKYKTPQGIFLDTEEGNTILAKGYAWCNNDVVNLLSNIVVTRLCLYLLKSNYNMLLF
jgi:uncharacterized protein (TIGR00297 family)